MPIRLIRQGLTGKSGLPPVYRAHPLKDRYDVVIIGGGAHGLACAY